MFPKYPSGKAVYTQNGWIEKYTPEESKISVIGILITLIPIILIGAYVYLNWPVIVSLYHLFIR